MVSSTRVFYALHTNIGYIKDRSPPMDFHVLNRPEVQTHPLPWYSLQKKISDLQAKGIALQNRVPQDDMKNWSDYTDLIDGIVDEIERARQLIQLAEEAKALHSCLCLTLFNSSNRLLVCFCIVGIYSLL